MDRPVSRFPAGSARRRGSVIIGTLFFILIVSILLMGIGQFTVSHQTRAAADVNYSSALYLAEAGINYEFYKLTSNPADADQYPGATYSFGGGVFTVYCTTNPSGSPPPGWTAPAPGLVVVASGTYNGCTRTLWVTGVGNGGSGDFAVFAVQSGTLNGTAMYVNGNVGTNGRLNFNGHPGVTGKVTFNGPGSGWAGNDPGGYPVEYNDEPVPWPTVDEIADSRFGANGLVWLSTHNDNNLCAAISNKQINLNGNGVATFVGKPGGANYYLTRLNLNGNCRIAFDNSAGPINIWMGPSGGSGTCTINGGTAVVSMSADPAKACRIYAATASGVTLNGNCNLDAGIYAYNKNAQGVPYGQVTNNGTPTVHGSILSNSVTLNGNPTVEYVPGYFQISNGGQYGYKDTWIEVNRR